MAIQVYGMRMTGPVRIVLLTLEALGKEYNYHEVNVLAGEHKTPEYLKMNPQHNIPVMKDGDVVLNESRAIATYLATLYGKNGQSNGLYPIDPTIRALVDQRLYFDAGVFYKCLEDVVFPKMGFSKAAVTEEHRERFKEVMGWISDFVSGTGFVAGTKEMTVADIAFATTYANFKATGAFDHFFAQYPAIEKWYESIAKALPNFEEVNVKGSEIFGNVYKSKA